jgi:hypothetical protein
MSYDSLSPRKQEELMKIICLGYIEPGKFGGGKKVAGCTAIVPVA